MTESGEVSGPSKGEGNTPFPLGGRKLPTPEEEGCGMGKYNIGSILDGQEGEGGSENERDC